MVPLHHQFSLYIQWNSVSANRISFMVLQCLTQSKISFWVWICRLAKLVYSSTRKKVGENVISSYLIYFCKLCACIESCDHFASGFNWITGADALSMSCRKVEECYELLLVFLQVQRRFGVFWLISFDEQIKHLFRISLVSDAGFCIWWACLLAAKAWASI